MANSDSEQLSLFLDFEDDKLTYNKIHVKHSTFLGGLSAPIHKWFRLTPSYGPDLVDIMLNEMETSQNHIILDPFSGAGTTLYQSKFNGLKSYGFEINPFLYFVCKTSITLDLDVKVLKETYEKIKAIYFETTSSLKNLDVEEIGIPLPKIHNVFRWWRKDILKDLLILRNAIETNIESEKVRNFFLLGIAGVLIPDLTNVTLGRLQLAFKDKSNEYMNVWESFSKHITGMIRDVESLDESVIQTPSTVFHTDSTELNGVEIPEKIDRVVTSPPYPNRYSYVWNTRPYLYFFNIFSGPKEAGELDKKTIGGTWGTATSILEDGVIEPMYPILEEKVWPVVEQIREKDNLMANYVMKYFNLIAKQIVVQDPLLSNNARCAYVVGNSEIKGVYIETDKLLADIFEGLGLGYSIHKIERFRKRNSGQNLYETIVYAYKN